ncbi:beta family protein [Sphingomonas fuzhouensis]|uniref:beta family protein n=1 Tax=Sphingomonas fuzhouensis TaxID=3106033 RepID=UPI002AFEE75B|nr:hypothetical protein [Sphingomonas sp. SGZ-02]
MPVEWSDVPYLPLLSIRPAEMRALEELPNTTKDRLLPIVHLRPWVGSHRLENATGRIAEAYGDRRVVIAMGEREQPNERPVHAELATLRQPAHGFREWCNFFEQNENYIPAMQFSPEVPEEEAQIARLFGLERGLVVIIERPAFGFMGVIARRVGERTGGGQGVCFVIDFGIASRDHLQVAAIATGYINTIREHAPAAYVALSASSFPDSFVGVSDQPIYERRLFDTMAETDRLIYSDRGSARVERQTGGGGQPAPRIDYPLFDLWDFYRSDDLVGFPGYQQQAINVMAGGNWNPALRVWGTQMIERTAAGDMSAIGSPQKATAARINLHLQLQTFYGAPGDAEDTDEDWSG